MTRYRLTHLLALVERMPERETCRLRERRIGLRESAQQRS